MAAVRRADEIAHVAKVALEDIHRAELVEGPDDVVAIPHPAVAVVPVAARVGRLGHRRGHRRDDCAGLLEPAELEGDRGPDHRLLPLERHMQVPHPLAPVGGGRAQKVLTGLRHRTGQALVRPEEQGDRLLEVEPRLVEDVGERRVGGEPDGEVRADVADVVGAVGDLRGPARVAEAGADADPDAGLAFDRAEDPDQGHRAVAPPELRETRREVGDLEGAPLPGPGGR